MEIKMEEQEVVENLVDSMQCSADTIKMFLNPVPYYGEDAMTDYEVYSFICELLDYQTKEIKEYIKRIKRFLPKSYSSKKNLEIDRNVK